MARDDQRDQTATGSSLALSDEAGVPRTIRIASTGRRACATSGDKHSALDFARMMALPGETLDRAHEQHPPRWRRRADAQDAGDRDRRPPPAPRPPTGGTDSYRLAQVTRAIPVSQVSGAAPGGSSSAGGRRTPTRVSSAWNSIPTVGLVGQFCDYALWARDAVQVRAARAPVPNHGSLLVSRQSRWGASGMKRRSFPVDPVRSISSTSATLT